ncbi:hypothetical protein AS593_06855 [Caulobacter vibrioides]|nr:hypothetical protein AS593_06855 [Caulobacter vibrioides]
MKLLLRDYLGSLRERGELDAILPDLLSGLGHTVLWRPGIGTTQNGVDFASVGPDATGRKTLYLYVIKSGDLTRAEWSASPQGVQASLDEVLYVFLKTRVRPEHRDLPVAICICFGGDYLEPVQQLVTGYIDTHTTATLRYEIWHGDHLANLLLTGVLGDKLLPKPLQSSFQKAVAMLDEPDVAIHHFDGLVRQLLDRAKANDKARLAAMRQLYIALWILFVWARDLDNLQAPCKASDLAVLAAWEINRPLLGKTTKAAKALAKGVDEMIRLHVQISAHFLETKILPHVGKRNALSLAVGSRDAIDVNLKLFDLLGQIAVHGLWRVFLMQRATGERREIIKRDLEGYVGKMFAFIENNPTLGLPVKDEHATEIALALLLWSGVGPDAEAASAWVHEMAGRLYYALASQVAYTCQLTDYAELAVHPIANDEDYRREVTASSTLVPLLACWAYVLDDHVALGVLAKLKKGMLSHCTFQTWMPDADTETSLWVGGPSHGVALSDLPITQTGLPLLALMAEQAADGEAFNGLSAVRSGMWPLALMAFRAQRLPIPPQAWIPNLAPEGGFPPYAEVAHLEDDEEA